MIVIVHAAAIPMTADHVGGNDGYRVVQLFPNEMPGVIFGPPVASLDEAKTKAEKLTAHGVKVEWHLPSEAENELFHQIVCVLQLVN